jgi:hypothetical protein
MKNYKDDKNQLFLVFNILRWGIVNNGITTFEEVKYNGSTFLKYSTDVYHSPLFIVAEHNRYPTSDEYVKFSHHYR